MIANLEAEKAVIMLMMHDKECCASILAEMAADDFTDARNRAAWECALKLSREGKPVELITVAGEIGDVGYYGQLGLSCGLKSSLHAYMDALREARRRRETIAACKTGIKEATAGEDGYFDRLQRDINAARDRAARNVEPVGDSAREAVAGIGRMEDRVKTGFCELDSVLAGFRRTDLVVIGARPSVGKTSFAMNIALNVAGEGKAVALFSLEMDKQSVLQRAAFSLGKCSQYDILRDDAEAAQRVTDAADKIAAMRLYIDDRGGLTPEQIRAESLMIQSREGGLEMVVVDYLGLLNIKGRKNGTRENEIAEASRAMKRLAMELKCPVLLLSQLSRGLETRQGDKTPRLADLRDSGAIEQDADVVIFLNRPAAFDSSADPSKAYAIVAKNRNGACRSVELIWHGEWFLFDAPWEREAQFAEAAV